LATGRQGINALSKKLLTAAVDCLPVTENWIIIIIICVSSWDDHQVSPEIVIDVQVHVYLLTDLRIYA